MKTYLITTGILFGLLVVAHVWRVLEEGTSLLHNPWWIGITALAALLCLWAFMLLGSRRGGDRHSAS